MIGADLHLKKSRELRSSSELDFPRPNLRHNRGLATDPIRPIPPNVVEVPIVHAHPQSNPHRPSERDQHAPRTDVGPQRRGWWDLRPHGH